MVIDGDSRDLLKNAKKLDPYMVYKALLRVEARPRCEEMNLYVPRFVYGFLGITLKAQNTEERSQCLTL